MTIKQPISDERLIELYQQAISIRDIGRLAGCSEYTVGERVRKLIADGKLEKRTRYSALLGRQFSQEKFGERLRAQRLQAEALRALKQNQSLN